MHQFANALVISDLFALLFLLLFLFFLLQAAKNALQAHFLKTIDNPLQIEEDSFASAPPQDTPPVV